MERGKRSGGVVSVAIAAAAVACGGTPLRVPPLTLATTSSASPAAGPRVSAGTSKAYEEAALATVSAWRFRPYVDRGAATPACALARFRYAPSDAQVTPALPAARFELPPAVEQPMWFPSDLMSRPPTPGVAFARLCRTPGSRAAPTFALLQSSGDASFDRAMFDERATAPVGERASTGKICWLRSGIAPARLAAQDMDLINGVAAWRYTPMREPTCTEVTFIYRQL